MDHYWKLNDGRVWSTKDNIYVDENNAGLVAYIAAGKSVSPIDTDDALQLYLMQSGFPEYGPKFIPTSVLTNNLRLELAKADLLEGFVDYLSSSNARTEYAFQNVHEVRRDGTVAAALKAHLGWTDEQLNQLFRQAW